MRRLLRICISVFLAVLTIGTAFADRLTFFDVLSLERDELQAYVRDTIAEPYGNTRKPQNYPQVVREKEALERYAQTLRENGEAIEKPLSKRIRRMHPEVETVRVFSDLSLDWKMLGTLLFTYGARMTDALKRNMQVEIKKLGLTVTVDIRFADFDEILWLDNETDWFAARNSYYYLNTIYEDDGEKRLLTSFNMPQEKLDSLAFPLDERWYSRIKTTWLRSRDGGVRMHTGMDVRCNHGSPIYACAGGTVNSVGYHVKGGYYVSVVDTDGYEYFYYHMKKNSQCVVRGQTVETGEKLGLSGNTGNSAAPHLHLSVITPDRRFVDPFRIYYRWVYQHTGVFVKKPS